MSEMKPNWYGLELYPAIAADDVMIAPGFSRVNGRQSADLGVTLAGFTLKQCVWLAPMDTTVNVPLAIEAGREGMIAVFHRADTIEERVRWVSEVVAAGVVAAAAIGSREVQESLLLAEAGAKFLVLDVADAGDSYDFSAFCELLELHADSDVILVIGNFANEYEVQPYLDYLFQETPGVRRRWKGRIIFKAGRSSGSICITAGATGVGITLFASVARISETLTSGKYRELDIKLIGDGGVKDGVYASKIIAAGASAGVMIGQIAAGMANSAAPESPDYPGHKVYRGMGSKGAREDARKRMAGIDDRYVKNGESAELIEGGEILVKITGSVHDTMEEFFAQMRAAMMGAGAGTIEEMANHKRFVLMQSDAARREMGIHAIAEQPKSVKPEPAK